MSNAQMTRREYILSQYPDCREFARDVLHIHVDGKGRALSLKGQKSHGNEALQLDREVWYDHSLKVGGTVIDLCAYAMFDGDVGRAMNYLAGDFYDIKASRWREEVEKITRLVWTWHKNLLPDDREYLHSRRITDETIERLQLGSMTADESGRHPRRRLVIPYFKNGRIVYYISRDRSGVEGGRKYMKCRLPRELDTSGRETSNDAEVLQNIPWGLWTLTRKDEAGQLTFNDGVKKSDWLIIAEGAFDAMSFEQEGYCVLGTMGGCFAKMAHREAIAQAKKFKNVLVIFDNDEAGGDFQRKMCKDLFAHRVNAFTATVPARDEKGSPIKDVSDYYTAGGELSRFIDMAQPVTEYLAQSIITMEEAKSFLHTAARFADKSDVTALYNLMRETQNFDSLWLKMLFQECLKAPAEPLIMQELEEAHNLRYVEGNGFFEYSHGVWKAISDNRVKGYADELLGHYSCNARMTSAMKFAQARLTTDEPMNTQPVINLQNGVLLPNDGCRFVQHSPSFLSTIQLDFHYDNLAGCDLWLQFLKEAMNNDPAKIMRLQEIGGYVFWPNNGLEKCFFLIGDGGNGKGVFMDTLKAVFGRDNCSALPLSSFGSQFDPIMLQYSLVNFASETRVDLKGNVESIKAVTSGDEIVAAHKGVDAVKFAPRCKLITSCNDFFNTGDITHALMRRMCFVKFNNNFVQKKQANVFLREALLKERAGILNWCIEGYLRLKERAEAKSPDIFTPTQEDRDLKREFMRTTNPVAFFIEEKLADMWDERHDTHDLYKDFKRFAEDNGYKALSLGAFTNRIKRVMREMRPEVGQEERRCHTWLVFPPRPDDFDSIDKELENEKS